jgi:hypothetical protein
MHHHITHCFVLLRSTTARNILERQFALFTSRRRRLLLFKKELSRGFKFFKNFLCEKKHFFSLPLARGRKFPLHSYFLIIIVIIIYSKFLSFFLSF